MFSFDTQAPETNFTLGKKKNMTRNTDNNFKTAIFHSKGIGKNTHVLMYKTLNHHKTFPK